MNGNQLNAKSAPPAQPQGRASVPVYKGFTLIELLAVIAIIGLLAGLVVGLSGLAVTKQREARMRAEHARLVTGIEAYKADLGFYPSENTNTVLVKSPENEDFDLRVGKSPLFYELSGAIFSNDNGGQFTTLHNDRTVKVTDLAAALGVRGVQNSSRDKKNVPYRGINFKPSQFAELDGSQGVQLLVTPLKGPYDSYFKVQGSSATMNPWFYRLTPTKDAAGKILVGMHNPEGFDLWTEYLAGSKKIFTNGVSTVVPATKVIGNWKE